MVWESEERISFAHTKLFPRMDHEAETKSPYPHWYKKYVKSALIGERSLTDQASGEMASFVDSSLSTTAAMAPPSTFPSAFSGSSCKTRGALVAMVAWVHDLPCYTRTVGFNVVWWTLHDMFRYMLLCAAYALDSHMLKPDAWEFGLMLLQP